jgi:hypothetical protein
MSKIIDLNEYRANKGNFEWLNMMMSKPKEELVDDVLDAYSDVQYIEDMFRAYFDESLTLDERKMIGVDMPLRDFCFSILKMEV